MRRSITVLLLSVASTLAVVGCNNGGGDDDDMSSIPCSEETRDDDYVQGLEKDGLSALLRTTLDTADPAPPDIGNNTWTITVLPMGASTAVGGCTITSVPMMPDHGHGTSPQPTITETTTSGEYEVTPINMFMGGLWEIPLDMDCGGSGSDTVVYRFCVES